MSPNKPSITPSPNGPLIVRDLGNLQNSKASSWKLDKPLRSAAVETQKISHSVMGPTPELAFPTTSWKVARTTGRTAI